MPYDIFSVATLNRVVDEVEPVPQFLLRRFFPSVQVSTSEEIHFDVRDGAPRLAPFVTPYQQGQIVEKRGYSTKMFKPAYIKDKRVFDANLPLKRMFGERIGGSLSPAARMQALVAQEIQDQEDMLNRRLEVMAADVLVDGIATIIGELYPELDVNFGRHADLSVALTGTNEWGDVGVDPLADLRTWSNLVHTRGKVRPTSVVMTPDAYNLFINSASVVNILDRPRQGQGTSITDQLPITSDEWPAGRIGGFDVTVYQGEYIDPMDNTAKDILPAFSVILGDSRLEGVQAFGAIRDHDAGLQARRSFVKSWVTEDPSVRYVMNQSAPLLVPYRVNAALYASVHA